MREFLKGLDLDKETIDTIMAEHGKLITEAKEKTQELENKVKEYESKIGELSSKAETNTNKLIYELIKNYAKHMRYRQYSCTFVVQ